KHANLFPHETRLLWLNDFTRLEIILAHCSRSAQGAGPLHYDQLLQDLGLLAFTLPQVAICMPTKTPRGQELPWEQHVANQALHQRRLRIEQVHSSVKRCRIVKD